MIFTVLFDAAHTRTIWLRNGESPVAVVFTMATICKFVILLLETIEKRRILRSGYRDNPPYATSGIINRTFFWWLNPLFRRGFSKTLAVNDLFTLDKPLVSARLHDDFGSAWSEGMCPLNFSF
jgi:ATP-binding cassette subfamily C (CFTR/MRP) protein 1